MSSAPSSPRPPPSAPPSRRAVALANTGPSESPSPVRRQRLSYLEATPTRGTEPATKTTRNGAAVDTVSHRSAVPSFSPVIVARGAPASASVVHPVLPADRSAVLPSNLGGAAASAPTPSQTPIRDLPNNIERNSVLSTNDGRKGDPESHRDCTGFPERFCTKVEPPS